MSYQKLSNWIDSDDACEVTDITLFSTHDADNKEEQDFIIRRLKSLVETGVSIKSIILRVRPQDNRPKYLLPLEDNHTHSVDVIINAINNIYASNESIETMTINVRT
jgi:hypothetical protein